jgi:selenocysteine lyase/cysteine desulfurase
MMSIGGRGERLGVLDKGGLVRIGFAHYNTADEVDRVLEELRRLAARHWATSS